MSSIGVATDRGLVRAANEDAAGFVRCATGLLVVVADGMGGHSHGDIASRMAVETLLFHGALAPPGYPPDTLLANAIVDANRRIHEYAGEAGYEDGMGTTIVAALIADRSLHVSHVGDSRAYLLRENVLHRITRDHSVVETLVCVGLLHAETSALHPDAGVLSFAAGARGDVFVDTLMPPVRPADDDVLLLCSDGLSALVSPDAIFEILCRRSDPQQTADALVDAARNAGGHDNITCIVVRLSGVPGTRAAVPVPSAPHAAELTNLALYLRENPSTMRAVHELNAVAGFSPNAGGGALDRLPAEMGDLDLPRRTAPDDYWVAAARRGGERGRFHTPGAPGDATNVTEAAVLRLDADERAATDAATVPSFAGVAEPTPVAAAGDVFLPSRRIEVPVQLPLPGPAMRIAPAVVAGDISGLRAAVQRGLSTAVFARSAATPPRGVSSETVALYALVAGALGTVLGVVMTMWFVRS